MLYLQSSLIDRLADGESVLAVHYSDEHGCKLLVDDLENFLPLPIPSRTAVVTIVTTENPVYTSGMCTGRRVWKPLDVVQIPLGPDWALGLKNAEITGVHRGVSRGNAEEVTEVSLTFEKIVIEHKSGKSMYQDDWSH